MKEAHLKALSMAKLKNGALIRNLEDLEHSFQRCYTKYPRKSQLEATRKANWKPHTNFVGLK